MKYLILIHGNQAWRDAFAAMPAEGRERGLTAYEDLTSDLEDTGELIAAAPLADPSTAVRVTVSPSGEVSRTDGPFAEAKEVLAGFYLVDCETAERALEIAARIPEAAGGLVEVHPTMSLATFDL